MAGGCGDDTVGLPDLDAGPGLDAGPAGFDAGDNRPETGIGTTTLILDRLVPDHGPYGGGTVSVLRGTGFTAEAEVEIGGRLVQPADTELIDSNRLRVVTPAGDPGFADVSVRVGGDEATLPDGYHYDAIEVTPNRGAVAGGTLITLLGQGTDFEDGDTVVVGRTDCSDVNVLSDTRLTCRTPAGAPGSVDVTYIDETDGAETVIEDGFTYYDSSDPFGGGLGGGPITGTLNISVINAATGAPEPDVFVIVGEDLSTPHQGLTNLLGQITFSGDDLMGEQTVHMAKFCFEKTSFVVFDASDVTGFLVPWMDPMCGMGSGELPPGRGRNGAFVAGELIWLGPNELGPNPWDNIPPPRDGEEKVAYVYTTQRCPGDDLVCVNPDPALGGAIQRVREMPLGDLGYPYRIFARPAGMAVYALAGLENIETGEFIPYVMGVGRNVLAGPGEEVEKDIIMNIPLDHTVAVQLDDLPGGGRTGPDRFRVDADIDLGGEGLIVRRVNGERFDVVRRRSNEQPFRFFAQPALLGTLVDGRYRVEAGWYTGDFDNTPATVIIRNGIREVASTVELDGWLGVPNAVSPAFGERLPADRMLRWEAEGAQPDLHVVLMIGGDGNPAWRIFLPGDVTQAPIPDLSSIPEIDDISSGFLTWVVFAIGLGGIPFEEFSYAYLNDLFWTEWSEDVFTAQL